MYFLYGFKRSYSTSNNNDINLIIKSYSKIRNKENAIINTNQGSVYFAYEYINLSNNLKFTRSMSHKGQCWENSLIENWFTQLKQEWIYPLGKITRKEAEQEIKKYVHWYNHERIQKKLGYLSPVQYRKNI